MKTFDFRHAESVDDAINAATHGATYFAGGTNLFDLMKTGVEQPSALIDLRRLAMTSITTTDGGGCSSKPASPTARWQTTPSSAGTTRSCRTPS